jgi:hypothetical protein
MSALTVRVDLNRLGGWEIALPGERDHVICETLDEARRVAYLCAARRHPCELVVCDAYQRVLHREFIDGDEGAEAASLANAESRGAGVDPTRAPCCQLDRPRSRGLVRG